MRNTSHLAIAGPSSDDKCLLFAVLSFVLSIFTRLSQMIFILY